MAGLLVSDDGLDPLFDVGDSGELHVGVLICGQRVERTDDNTNLNVVLMKLTDKRP